MKMFYPWHIILHINSVFKLFCFLKHSFGSVFDILLIISASFPHKRVFKVELDLKRQDNELKEKIVYPDNCVLQRRQRRLGQHHHPELLILTTCVSDAFNNNNNLFYIAPQQQLYELLAMYRSTNATKHTSICY